MIAFIAAILVFWLTNDVGFPFEQRAFLTAFVFCGIGLSSILDTLKDIEKSIRKRS